MLTNSLLFIEDPPSDRNCFRTPVAGASGRSINSAKVSCITVTSLLRSTCILILRNVFSMKKYLLIYIVSLKVNKISSFIFGKSKSKSESALQIIRERTDYPKQPVSILFKPVFVWFMLKSACWIALTLNNRPISTFSSAKVCSSTCSSYSHLQDGPSVIFIIK